MRHLGMAVLWVFSRDSLSFFEAYEEKFDKIYFISPNFASAEEEAYKLIDESDWKSAAETISADYIMDKYTKEFIKEIKEYNSNGCLANYIYYCKPEVTGYNPLSFDEEEQQYNDTISWGTEQPG